MRFRKLKLSDVNEIVKLISGERALEDYAGEYSSEVIRKMVHDKNTIAYVFEDKKGHVAAFLEIKLDKIQKRAYLETIIVAKEYRGRGIATLLMKEMEAIARNRKLKRISFLVRKWNKPMNFLAENKGYKKKDELIFWDKELK
jgi:ribosomal protein S18 acetylase RimI-like enzyme